MESTLTRFFFQLIRELNRETSHHRHLAVGLGGSGDCERLRDELKRSRRRAQDLARQAKIKLDPHLQEYVIKLSFSLVKRWH